MVANSLRGPLGQGSHELAAVLGALSSLIEPRWEGCWAAVLQGWAEINCPLSMNHFVKVLWSFACEPNSASLLHSIYAFAVDTASSFSPPNPTLFSHAEFSLLSVLGMIAADIALTFLLLHGRDRAFDRLVQGLANREKDWLRSTMWS